MVIRPAVLAIAACVTFSGCTGTDCDDYAFDGEKWIADRGDDRYELAKGLVECDWLVGKSRQEVADGLGKAGRNSSRTWSYRLYLPPLLEGSPPAGGGPKLVVTFDGSRVSRAEVVE